MKLLLGSVPVHFLLGRHDSHASKSSRWRKHKQEQIYIFLRGAILNRCCVLRWKRGKDIKAWNWDKTKEKEAAVKRKRDKSSDHKSYVKGVFYTLAALMEGQVDGFQLRWDLNLENTVGRRKSSFRSTCFKGTVHFGKYTYALSGRGSDEKTDATLKSAR